MDLCFNFPLITRVCNYKDLSLIFNVSNLVFPSCDESNGNNVFMCVLGPIITVRRWLMKFTADLPCYFSVIIPPQGSLSGRSPQHTSAQPLGDTRGRRHPPGGGRSWSSTLSRGESGTPPPRSSHYSPSPGAVWLKIFQTNLILLNTYLHILTVWLMASMPYSMKQFFL